MSPAFKLITWLVDGTHTFIYVFRQRGMTKADYKSFKSKKKKNLFEYSGTKLCFSTPITIKGISLVNGWWVWASSSGPANTTQGHLHTFLILLTNTQTSLR